MKTKRQASQQRRRAARHQAPKGGARTPNDFLYGRALVVPPPTSHIPHRRFRGADERAQYEAGLALLGLEAEWLEV